MFFIILSLETLKLNILKLLNSTQSTCVSSFISTLQVFTRAKILYMNEYARIRSLALGIQLMLRVGGRRMSSFCGHETSHGKEDISLPISTRCFVMVTTVTIELLVNIHWRNHSYNELWSKLSFKTLAWKQKKKNITSKTLLH